MCLQNQKLGSHPQRNFITNIEIKSGHGTSIGMKFPHIGCILSSYTWDRRNMGRDYSTRATRHSAHTLLLSLTLIGWLEISHRRLLLPAISPLLGQAIAARWTPAASCCIPWPELGPGAPPPVHWSCAICHADVPSG